MVISTLVFLAFLGVLLYFQIFATINHFSAPDPNWSSFPLSCVNQQNSFNCIRVGNGIKNGMTTTGNIMIPLFSTSLQNGQNIVQNVVRDYLKCNLITTLPLGLNEVFIHYRCLTDVLGYPDDFAINLYCEDRQIVLWIHSQSRLGLWDHNVNDARVRLFWNVLHSDLFTYNSSLSNGETCQ